MPRGDTPPQPRARAVALALAVIALVIAAAAALPEGFALSGRDRAAGGVVAPDPPAVAGYLVVALVLVALALWLLAQVVGLRGRGRSDRREMPVWLQLIIVLLALLLPGLAGVRELFDRAPERTTQSEREAPPGAEGEQRSRALGIAVTVLLGVLLTAVVGGLAWLFWPERARASPEPERRAAILEQLSGGLVDLERITEPRAAVISCYARMEQLLAAAGVTRHPSDTPLELLARVLIGHRAAEPSVARLTALFERARFSDHHVDESMRRRALTALAEVRDQIKAAT